MEATATLVTDCVRYIGVLQGKLRQPAAGIGEIAHGNLLFTGGTGGGRAQLANLLRFPHGTGERDPDKYASYIFSLHAEGRDFVNSNYLRIWPVAKIRRRMRRYAAANEAALGRRESFWRTLWDFTFSEDKHMLRQMLTNPIRADDLDTLLAQGAGQVMVYGGIPVNEDEQYLILGRERAELRCSKISIPPHAYPAAAISRARALKREIIVGGSFNPGSRELVLHYLCPRLRGYYFYGGSVTTS